MTQLHRIQPLGRPQDYQTYSILAPLETHWRNASCAEVDCLVSASGWRTTVEENTPLGAQQAGYIRTQSGRHYTELGRGMVVFTFPAGEECFTTHRIKADREPFYLKRHGDYRWFAEQQRYDKAHQWVEDFDTHLDKIDKQQR